SPTPVGGFLDQWHEQPRERGRARYRSYQPPTQVERFMNFTLTRPNVAVLLIDVQEKLFDHVERSEDILRVMCTALQGFQILGLPIFATEQSPAKLGATIPELKKCLPAHQNYLAKTTFSCVGDETVKKILLSEPVKHWIL